MLMLRPEQQHGSGGCSEGRPGGTGQEAGREWSCRGPREECGDWRRRAKSQQPKGKEARGRRTEHGSRTRQQDRLLWAGRYKGDTWDRRLFWGAWLSARGRWASPCANCPSGVMPVCGGHTQRAQHPSPLRRQPRAQEEGAGWTPRSPPHAPAAARAQRRAAGRRRSAAAGSSRGRPACS